MVVDLGKIARAEESVRLKLAKLSLRVTAPMLSKYLPDINVWLIWAFFVLYCFNRGYF